MLLLKVLCLQEAVLSAAACRRPLPNAGAHRGTCARREPPSCSCLPQAFLSVVWLYETLCLQEVLLNAA